LPKTSFFTIRTACAGTRGKIAHIGEVVAQALGESALRVTGMRFRSLAR
jgi:hypothetical protein